MWKKTLWNTDQCGGEGEVAGGAVLNLLCPCAHRVIQLQVLDLLKRRYASALNIGILYFFLSPFLEQDSITTVQIGLWYLHNRQMNSVRDGI